MYDEYDDLIDELNGWRLYAVGMINEGTRAAALGLNTTLTIAGAILDLVGSLREFCSSAVRTTHDRPAARTATRMLA